MALTYVETSNLMTNMIFRGRIKVSCLHYADYIFGEAANTAAHSSRIRWAQSTFQNPDMAAANVTPAVCMDAAVQSAALTPEGDSTIDDVALQSATENAINKML